MLAQNVSNTTVVETFADALERATDGSHSAAKEVAQRVGRSVATVRNWFRRSNGPGAAELIELCREFDEVYEAFQQLCGRAPDKISAHQREQIDAALEILQRARRAA